MEVSHSGPAIRWAAWIGKVRTSPRFWGLAALTGAAITLAGAPVRGAEHSLHDFAQPALKDVTARIRILSHNDSELEKVGKGYVDIYKMSDQQLWAKEPGRTRVQGRKGLLTLRYVTNGTRKLTEVTTLHLHKIQDIATQPTQGYHISELGVITPDWLDTIRWQYIRDEVKDGKNLEEFDYWYKGDKEPALRNTIWVDPATKTVVEHIMHHHAKKKAGFKKRIVYSLPKQFNGVWMPTHLSLYSPENKLAGELQYESIQVNTSLADSLFKF